MAFQINENDVATEETDQFQFGSSEGGCVREARGSSRSKSSRKRFCICGVMVCTVFLVVLGLFLGARKEAGCVSGADKDRRLSDTEQQGQEECDEKEKIRIEKDIWIADNIMIEEEEKIQIYDKASVTEGTSTRKKKLVKHQGFGGEDAE